MKKLLYLLPLILFACAEPALTDLQRQEQQAARVEIIRDDYGVAHVYGQTDADAVFGLLYAQCEDDFKRVERNYIWAIGRLAEVDGEEAIYSDLRARLFMTKEEAIANFERAPEYIRKLCIAWADGINYYLYKNPDVKPALLTKFEPWMPMYFSEGSIGGDIERVRTWKIKEFYEPDTQVAHLENDAPLSEEEWLVEPKGSNGIAISGDRTASGDAMLLINPHTTFYFRGEYHVVSEEGLNAYGAITWGQFFIYQGFNENTGWMHTSTYTDVIDEFVETIEERDGKRMYKYGEEWREVEEKSVTLKYRDGDAMNFRTFPMYRTHHGPITQTIDGKWVATSMMWEPVKALEQSFIRTKQKNYAEFREMMNIRTNSSNNTVFADSEGNIGYFHGNFVPKRDTTFDYTQPVDGSNPDTDWKGLHPVDECITILNPSNGWIQNCNSTPFTAAAENSPKKEDYPNYMSRIPENFRGVHARQILPDARNITLDGLIDLAYDPYLPAFEKVIPGLIAAYDNNMGNYPNLAEPLEVLRNWDLTTSQESVAMSLAHFYGNSLKSNVQVQDTLVGMDRFHFFGTDLAEEERLNQFANAVELLAEDFGRWDTPWGEICRFQRLSGDIDLKFDDEQESLPVGLTTAHWGALASFGTWSNQNTKRIYGTAGNSFVAVVQFGDSLRAKTLLAGGQSGDPSSPHFYDQAQLYADEQFKDVAFYRKDVEARAERRYRPGE
ncbi:MAG: acylase [Cyclobacteriaceae bacterium]